MRESMWVVIATCLVVSCLPTKTKARAVPVDGGGTDETNKELIAEYPKRLNPSGPWVPPANLPSDSARPGELAFLYMGAGEGCHWIPADVPIPKLMDAINNTEPTSCDELQDPAWRECPFGALFANADRTGCICRRADRPAQKLNTCPK